MSDSPINNELPSDSPNEEAFAPPQNVISSTVPDSRLKVALTDLKMFTRMLNKNRRRIHAALSRNSSAEYLQALRNYSAFGRRRIARIHAAIRPFRKAEIEAKHTPAVPQKDDIDSSVASEGSLRKRRRSVASGQGGEGKGTLTGS